MKPLIVLKALRGVMGRAKNTARSVLADLHVQTWRKICWYVTFIGITGSCGKTTTTQLVGTVLSSKGPCRIGSGNNSHIALMRNILSVNRATKFCVQEVSGSRPGRVARHFRVLRPSIGIVTTIGSDHYKNFRSLEATAHEKGRLIELLPSSGIAILNADDPNVFAMARKTGARVITFGRSEKADVRAKGVSSPWPNRLRLTVTYGDETCEISTKLVGEHWTTSVLGAVACGLVCGMDLNECAKAISNFEPIFGRYSVHAKANGPVYILDHKAPFWTVATGLDFIRGARASRKTIVFGTISDYPGKASRRYRRIARQAMEVAERIVFVGPHSGHLDKLKQQHPSRLFTFVTTYQASQFLAETAVVDELIYLKGSMQADHLERIMLSQLDRVVCWQEKCRQFWPCVDCPMYRTASAPPFGLCETHNRSGKDRTEWGSQNFDVLFGT